MPLEILLGPPSPCLSSIPIRARRSQRGVTANNPFAFTELSPRRPSRKTVKGFALPFAILPKDRIPERAPNKACSSVFSLGENVQLRPVSFPRMKRELCVQLAPSVLIEEDW